MVPCGIGGVNEAREVEPVPVPCFYRGTRYEAWTSRAVLTILFGCVITEGSLNSQQVATCPKQLRCRGEFHLLSGATALCCRNCSNLLLNCDQVCRPRCCSALVRVGVARSAGEAFV